MPLIRLGLAASLVLALTACGGGGLGNVLGPNPTSYNCDPGTQVQLANPQSGQTGVNGNLGQIVIVAQNSNNALGNGGSSQWNLILTPQFGGSQIQGGQLSPVDGRTLVHPWPTGDFYYASSIGSLPQGVTWNVGLAQQTGNYCTPVNIGEFST